MFEMLDQYFSPLPGQYCEIYYVFMMAFSFLMLRRKDENDEGRRNRESLIDFIVRSKSAVPYVPYERGARG